MGSSFPGQGSNPGPMHWEVRSLSHWTTREVLLDCFIRSQIYMTLGIMVQIPTWPRSTFTSYLLFAPLVLLFALSPYIYIYIYIYI